MHQATITLVNHQHKDKSFHVLAKSGNLFLELDEKVPLSEWLKTRADMPDSVEEAFNPEVTEDWAENVSYVCQVEPLVCLYERVYWRVYEENGYFKGYHPDAIWVKGKDGESHPILLPDVDETISDHHIASSLEDNESSLKELKAEMKNGLLKGDKYDQELKLLTLLVKVK